MKDKYKFVWERKPRRYTWEYYRRDFFPFRWYGDWGPWTPLGGLRHEYGYRTITEKGMRRKLARMILRDRRQKDREMRKVASRG